MGRNDLCFCGSNKKYKNCHAHINEESLLSDLLKLNVEIDKEIEKQKREKNLNFLCSKGCSECCSQSCNVSESEFVLVLDYIINHWETEKVKNIINKAIDQWNIVKKEQPDLAANLEKDLTGKIDQYKLLSTLMPRDIKLPFPCMFLDEDSHSCTIYDVRPLICRIHGVSIIDDKSDVIPCSKQKNILSNKENLVDLRSYYDRFTSFMLMKYHNKIIFRRPFPLFYLFNFVFEDGLKIEDFHETLMFYKIAKFNKARYLNYLAETYKIK